MRCWERILDTLGEDLWGFARICDFGRGFARLWERICEDLQGFVRICEILGEDLQGFTGICKDS